MIEFSYYYVGEKWYLKIQLIDVLPPKRKLYVDCIGSKVLNQLNSKYAQYEPTVEKFSCYNTLYCDEKISTEAELDDE